MEVAASTIAVMQLCFQIVDSVQRVRTFVRSVKEAPEELQRLIDKIDFLWHLLGKIKDLIELQRELSSHNASMTLISTALAPCVSSVKRLEDNVDQLRDAINHPSVLQRKRHALRSVTRKDVLAELNKNVNENITNLQAVLMVEAIELQLLKSQSSPGHARPWQAAAWPLDTSGQPTTTPDHTQELEVFHSPPCAKRQIKILRDVESTEYHSILGHIHVRKETEYRSGSPGCAQRWSLVISSSFLPAHIEWQSLRIYGQIARTLISYPMLSRPFLYFEMCSTGDMSALQSALSRREISLCARDESGGTLLHFAAIAENFEICSFLLQLGANPDQRNFDGSTPFHMLVMISSAERSRLDCLRLLIEAQLDVTEEDLNWFYMLYSGPPEAAEIIFAYDTDFNPIPSRRNARTTALHMALRHLVRGSEQWYGMTRRLLRTKLNIHAQDRRRRSALDEVLKPFECPCNPDAAVATWLSILRDESIDIGAYLKQELTLDFREHHSSCNGCQRIPKGSHCVFGNRPFIHEEIMVVELDPPRVWLDSHFDPKSSASLVWDEFGHFTSYHYDACARLEFLWPFDFPKWSRVHYWRDDPKGNSHSLDLAFQGRFELARRRRDRRVEKKAQKLVRSQRHRGPRLIPGAWIA